MFIECCAPLGGMTTLREERVAALEKAMLDTEVKGSVSPSCNVAGVADVAVIFVGFLPTWASALEWAHKRSDLLVYIISGGGQLPDGAPSNLRLWWVPDDPTQKKRLAGRMAQLMKEIIGSQA